MTENQKNKNSEYWADRFSQLEDAQNGMSSKTVFSLQNTFDKTQKELEKQINNWYMRVADNNEISMADAKKLLSSKELAELKWDIKDYIKAGEQNAVDQKWMKELENASARFHISRLEALKLQTQQQIEMLYGRDSKEIQKHLMNIYNDGYYHTAFEIQKGTGVGFNVFAPDQRKLNLIMSKPWAADGKNFSERLWGAKEQLISNVHNSLTQMCVMGQSADKAINSLSKAMHTSKSQTARLVMTESAFFSSQAQKECFSDLDVEEYEIVATLDTHTSERCRELDGKHFPVKDMQPGVTAPPFHVNCRTCTCPYFNDEFSSGERAARNEDGDTYYVPDSMKYKDWEKAFKEGGSKATLKKIVPEKTIAEKINAIKDRIANSNAPISEDDIKEAGKAMKEEISKNTSLTERASKIEELRKENDELYEQYKKARDEEDRFAHSKKRNIQELDSFLEKGTISQKDYDAGIQQLSDEELRLKTKKEKITNDWLSSGNKYRVARDNKFFDNAKDIKAELSKVRSMGITNEDINEHLVRSRSPMKKVVTDAYDYYPSDWVSKSVSKGSLTPKKVDRGYYSEWERIIAISGDGQEAFETAIHELGHRFERAVPEIRDAEKEFYKRRTAECDLEWLGNGYSKSEKSRFDSFLHPYMGKDYGGSAYELVSMGFQYAYTDPTLLMQDEDFAEWILGLLSLY